MDFLLANQNQMLVVHRQLRLIEIDMILYWLYEHQFSFPQNRHHLEDVVANSNINGQMKRKQVRCVMKNTKDKLMMDKLFLKVRI